MTHQNFQQARENMVVSQLQPSGIVSERIMAAYRAVPREMFVPNAMRGVSYLDDSIALGGGRSLMEPILFAFMLQNARLESGDKVLDIGCASGYSSAVLAHLTDHVVALEQEEKLLQNANDHWETLGILNKISAIVGDHTDGYPEGSPYKAIFINGAVAEVPASLFKQLSDDGAIYTVLMSSGEQIGNVVSLRQDKSGFIEQTILGAGHTDYLIGFFPKKSFVF